MPKLFAYGHLEREDLLAVSKPFAELAERVVALVPAEPERTVSLRKLLETSSPVPAGKITGLRVSRRRNASGLRPTCGSGRSARLISEFHISGGSRRNGC